MRPDRLAHFFAGVSLVYFLSAMGLGPKVQTVMAFGVAIGWEKVQRPQNDGLEQSRDILYTLVGSGVAGAIEAKRARDVGSTRELRANAAFNKWYKAFTDSIAKAEDDKRRAIQNRLRTVALPQVGADRVGVP